MICAARPANGTRPCGIVNVADHSVGADPVPPQLCLVTRQGFAQFPGIRRALNTRGEEAGDTLLCSALEFVKFSGRP
jgi:hypothetical protein